MSLIIAQTVSQVVLPAVLGSVMLGMGLSLQVNDFKAVLKAPKAVMIVFLLQLLLLPILALVIIKAFSLNQTAAAGLFYWRYFRAGQHPIY